MNPPAGRRLLVGVVTATLSAGAVVALAPAASGAPLPAPVPAPVFHTLSHRPVMGDLTGDGVPDRTALGSVTRGGVTSCAYQLEAGLGGGRYAAPYVGRLPIAGTDPDGALVCADLGVVLRGPDPSRNQLAVTQDSLSFNGGPGVQTFRGFATHRVRYSGGMDGMYQPSQLASVDFDGDGYGDVWESTDQGSGFEAFVGRAGTGWHQLYSTPFTSGASPQFFDLNRNGGTDIVVTWADFGLGSGAAVVDGRTGATQVLLTGAAGDGIDFTASVIDIDHNAYPDVLVTEAPEDGTATTTHRFVNRSQGGRWYFQELPSLP